MAMIYTSTATDVANRIKSAKESNKQLTAWEEYLSGMQSLQEAESSAVSSNIGYDISGAYANYKQQQRQLLSSSKLGTGFKEEMSEALKSDYSSAYSSLKAQEASQLYDIQSKYEKQISDTEKQITERAGKLANVENAILNYMKTQGVTEQQLWTTDTSGTQTATPYYKAKAQELIYGEQGYENFAKYMQNQGMWDYFLENRPDINKYVLGLDATTSASTPEVKSYLTDYERKSKYENIISGGASNIPDENKSAQEYEKEILNTEIGNKAQPLGIDRNKYNVTYVYYNEKQNSDFYKLAKNAKVGDIIEYRGTVYKKLEYNSGVEDTFYTLVSLKDGSGDNDIKNVDWKDKPKDTKTFALPGSLSWGLETAKQAISELNKKRSE